jgi:hypothetical protein
VQLMALCSVGVLLEAAVSAGADEAAERLREHITERDETT